LAVPLEIMTKIIEPVYIAFTKSLEAPQKMQFNLLDHASWEAKASVAVVVRGWYKIVEWSRQSNDGMRKMFPSRNQVYDRDWETLFGEFFENKLGGHSIGQIVIGNRRRAITSTLPRPSREAYVNPPACFFPVGASVASPPRPSVPVASTSGSSTSAAQSSSTFRLNES
jgi:hypothetical protein